MQQEFLQRMLGIAKRGGEIALEFIDDSAPMLKPDNSVLTKADTAISRYVKEQLSDLLKTDDHILIEEENTDNPTHYANLKLKQIPYWWVVDPIDGTRGYSNKMPLFGISIGLLKDAKPWLGIVFFPAAKELFFCDGSGAYFVKNAFTKDVTTIKIVPMDQNITNQSIIFGHDKVFEEFIWDSSLCQLMLVCCATIDLCWPAIGRGAGCFLRSYIWDFAGSWPICQAAGLELRAISSGKVMDRIDLNLFEGQGPLTWKLKEHYLLCSERNFTLIKNHLKKIEK